MKELKLKVKVETGLEQPAKGKGRPAGTSKYLKLLSELKEDQSLVVNTLSARSNMFRAAKILGVSIITRKESNKEGYRIWIQK